MKTFRYSTALILLLLTVSAFSKRQNTLVCNAENSILQSSYSRQSDRTVVDWHPTENWIVVNDGQSNYLLIDPSRGAVISEITRLLGPTIIQISPDGQYLAVLGDIGVELNSIADSNVHFMIDFGRLDQEVVGEGVSSTLDWHPDSIKVAFGNYQLHILDVNTRMLQTLQPDENLAGVSALALGWNPSGDLLAVYNGYDALIFLETNTWNIVREIRWEPSPPSLFSPISGLFYPQAPQALSWNPDGTKIAINRHVSDGFQVKVWDVNSGELVTELPICEGQIRALVWSPDGQHLAVSYARPLETEIERFIRIWDMTTYEVVAITAPLENNVAAIDWSPDSQQLVSISDDGMVYVWEMP